MYFKIKSEQTKVVNKNDKLNEIMIRYMIIIRKVETENGKEKRKKRIHNLSLGKGLTCRDIQHRDR